jgi:hypothetical protein
MSDEKPVATPTPPAPEPTIQNPMMSWIRGGTITSAYEKQLAEQKAAAAKARAIEDSKRIAAERNPNEARQHKHVLGGNKKFPGIVLEVRETRDHKVLDYVECELNLSAEGHLILTMCCAWCWHRAGITQNFNIRQNHRHFELDIRRRGELWVDPNDPKHIVTLAGTIQMEKPFTCPNLGCGKQFVIDNSVVREK